MSTRQTITFPQLPLAVYREIIAHLRQIQGINGGLTTQDSLEFNYKESQIKHLWLEYSEILPSQDQEKVKAILDYYAQRQGINYVID